ncbi:MAG: rod shape-determining protein MreC [Lachnospiraceae bacterium]|nr:rod shape-determining protein MreC [Lachnospiraceae bacterium]MDD7177044.1 rod shape-determining protein MreC [bacterium]MDY5517792.1 rod shape-determining protein MreC [Lachnospiraceae bacterium]
MARVKRKKKTIPAKYILLVLTGICFLLMLGSFALGWTSGPVGTAASYVFIPMQKGLTTVGNWMSDKTSELTSLKDVMKENEALKIQVDELTDELNTLKLEQYDTEDLRELLALDNSYSEYNKLSASVIGKDAGNWFDTFLIDKGSEDGVAEGMNVITGRGLAGIVTEVGPNYAKVRAIIDDTSSVSGMVLSTSDNCIIKGNLQTMDDRQMITFSNLKDTEGKVAVGDQVVTSYISSEYVQGLLIGYISEIHVNSNNLTKSGLITPVVDFEHVKHVLVITDLKTTTESTEEQ